MPQTDPPSSKGARKSMRALFDGYTPLDGTQDEVFSQPGQPWPGLESVVEALGVPRTRELRSRQALADASFRSGGITFSVYSDNRGVEKIFPFDLMPRPITHETWERLERGLQQRVHALNLFIADMYGDQRSLSSGAIPRELIENAAGFLRPVRGVRALGDIWTHIAGIDLIRDADGTLRVLEDNLRCPSGVSYVLENRAVLKRAFPHAFSRAPVASVEEYPLKLRAALEAISPSGGAHPPVLLSPGPFNSAFFEHSFLARRMGVELVQGSDLFVDRGEVWVKTTSGPRKVDVIYRRIDDTFLDPETFREDSLLGVPGLFRVWAEGRLALANAPGNGVADDKAIYPYVPDIIRYFTGEEPLIEQVPTFVCARDKDRKHVLGQLDQLVVKAVDEAGGYGMLFGPTSSSAERETFAAAIEAHPRRYIAQRVVELSTCPVWTGRKLVPRRVDLRPYVICKPGADPWVLPGGLTRVALRAGSYVVNSSQGGGSKDTWVLNAPPSNGGQP